MKKWLLIASVLTGLLSTSLVLAADQPTTANVKIGVVDVRQVLQKIPQMSAVNSQLEKQFKPRQEKIVEAQKSLKTLSDKLNRDSAVMSETERTQLQDKIIADRANGQALVTTFQQDLSNAQNRAMQKLLTQIAEIVNRIAKDSKYDLILQGENVPYVDKKLNITDQVIEEMSKKG